MGWESITPANCKGWLANAGDQTARDVRVYLRYSMPQGDTVRVFSYPAIKPHQLVAINAPPQVTRSEIRFPHLEYILFSGQSQDSITGEPPPSPGYPQFPCLMSPDSARVYVRNALGVSGMGGGLAYHVVVDIETPAGVAEVPLLQNPIGLMWQTGNCPWQATQGCDGWGTFHVPVRDSTGIKLMPRLVRVRWENYAGATDTLVLPNPYYAYSFNQYGFSAICAP